VSINLHRILIHDWSEPLARVIPAAARVSQFYDLKCRGDLMAPRRRSTILGGVPATPLHVGYTRPTRIQRWLGSTT
jgi:hypothetical protein